MYANYLLTSFWHWFNGTGIYLLILFLVALLIPRIGRFAQRWINRGVEENSDADENKTRLALTGVSIYIVQMIAYFLLLVYFLQALGFSLASAAIPATVVSAAIGFGAQSIIADFLAGFFILTEKQFGVGDWVKFEGNGIVVEGTVIQVTMRATRIRTLAQETVIIPNSTAKVCVNASNYWSRAVVVMPVPLLGSKDPQDAIDRSEAAAQRALKRKDIASELIGELDVHPAVDISPPATIGMPWTVDMRFMVQVLAGSQWLVERAIRTAVLEEFWEEYGSAATMNGPQHEIPTIDAESAATSPGAGSPAPETPTLSQPAAGALHLPTSAPAQAAAATSATAVTAVTAVTAGTGASSSFESKEDEAATPPPEFERDPAIVDEEEEQTKQNSKVFRNEEVSGWRKLMSVGGRVRPSTTMLFGLLGLALLFQVFTLDTSDWDEQSGVLSPSTPTSVTPEVPHTQQTWPSSADPTVDSSAPETTGTVGTEPTSTDQEGSADTPSTGAPNPSEEAGDTAGTSPSAEEPTATPTGAGNVQENTPLNSTPEPAQVSPTP